VRVKCLVYGNTDLGGGKGWRIVATSPGFSARQLAGAPALCNNLMAALDGVHEQVCYVWLRQGLAGTDVLVRSKRYPTDAYGRPGGWMFYLAVPEGKTRDTPGIASLMACCFIDISHWESGARIGTLQRLDVADERTVDCLSTGSSTDGDPYQQWLLFLARFLARLGEYPSSIAFPVGHGLEGFDVIGVRQGDGHMSFVSKRRSHPMRSVLILALVVILAAALAWDVRRGYGLEKALAREQSMAGALSEDNAQLRDDVQRLETAQQKMQTELEGTQAELEGTQAELEQKRTRIAELLRNIQAGADEASRGLIEQLRVGERMLRRRDAKLTKMAEGIRELIDKAPGPMPMGP